MHCFFQATNVAQLLHLVKITVLHCTLFTKIALDQFRVQTVEWRTNVTQRTKNHLDFFVARNNTCTTANGLSKWTVVSNTSFASFAALPVNVDVSNRFVVCTAHPFVLKELAKNKIIANFVIAKKVVIHRCSKMCELVRKNVFQKCGFYNSNGISGIQWN